MAVVPVTVLDELAPTRRAVLEHLRLHGEARAEALGAALGITPGAARQQLAGLLDAGLVAHRDERPGPGRPRRHWSLAPPAEALFPKTYGELAGELLGYVEDEDPELLERIFERRRRKRTDDAAARVAGLELGERVAAVAAILDEQGYLADFTAHADGTFAITEHNCAILAVARRHGHACSTELAFLRELIPDADVERVGHILAGAHACTYRVTPRART